jgi:hypothetical protein
MGLLRFRMTSKRKLVNGDAMDSKTGLGIAYLLKKYLTQRREDAK